MPPGFEDDIHARLSTLPDEYEVQLIWSGDVPIAFLVDRDFSGDVSVIRLLGCPLCIRPGLVSRNAAGRLCVAGRETIPLSAIMEDDSRNPLFQQAALCPDCGNMVVDPALRDSPIPGVMGDYRDG